MTSRKECQEAEDGVGNAHRCRVFTEDESETRATLDDDLAVK